jgi:ATP-dependent DNA ligase
MFSERVGGVVRAWFLWSTRRVGGSPDVKLPVMPPVAPMLAKPVAAIPPGEFYEPKWDGFRSIVFRDGDEVEIGSRKERPMTRYFPEVVEAVRRDFPRRAVIDGEIVVAGDGGLDFWALQQRIHPAASRVALLAAATPARLIASTCSRSAMTISRGSRLRRAAPRSSGRWRTRRLRST